MSYKIKYTLSSLCDPVDKTTYGTGDKTRACLYWIHVYIGFRSTDHKIIIQMKFLDPT